MGQGEGLVPLVPELPPRQPARPRGASALFVARAYRSWYTPTSWKRCLTRQLSGWTEDHSDLGDEPEFDDGDEVLSDDEDDDDDDDDDI